MSKLLIEDKLIVLDLKLHPTYSSILKHTRNLRKKMKWFCLVIIYLILGLLQEK